MVVGTLGDSETSLTVGASLFDTSSLMEVAKVSYTSAEFFCPLPFPANTARFTLTVPEPVLGAVQSKVHDAVVADCLWVAWRPFEAT